MKPNKISALFIGAALPFFTGCKLIQGSVLAVAAVIGLAGYAVYKTGDLAVTGVKKVATTTGEVATGSTKAVGTVIFFKGNFKTEHPYGIRFVSMGTVTSLLNAGFKDVKHSTDALSGDITAKTRTGTEIKITLKNIEANRTSLTLRFGVKGNLEESEKINNMIAKELELMYIRTTGNKPPEKS